ncbi:MAB_1171c family putative transporter [Krasilnikovia sp. MM14-A1259]|uniref:MAB_1171c family putative transporter n=1 Tax=Krasilnikovia sp. MM14-A1259 TaxID=3373539 RepID=UPI0037F86001
MDIAAIYRIGLSVELTGALALWLALALRVPSARHSRQQRMLLFAVAGLAGSITVYLDPVSAALNRTFVFANSCGLFMNIWGVLASALILDFVLAATARRRPLLVYGLGTAVSVALIVLNATIAPHAGCVSAQVVPWYSPFWWLLIVAHLVATVPSAALCARYAVRAGNDRALRTGLLLLAAGFVSSTVFWLIVLAYLLARPAWLGAFFPLNIGITAWLMTAGVALPLFLDARRQLRNRAALWRLWPLWRDLAAAVPHVVLDEPRGRVRQLLGRPRTTHLRLYRQVVEIRDAMLVLRDYVNDEEMDLAAASAAIGRSPRRHTTSPAVVAVWLDVATRNKANGVAPQRGQDDSAADAGHDLDSEVAFLRDLCRARTAAPAHAIATRTAAPAGRAVDATPNDTARSEQTA